MEATSVMIRELHGVSSAPAVSGHRHGFLFVRAAPTAGPSNKKGKEKVAQITGQDQEVAYPLPALLILLATAYPA